MGKLARGLVVKVYASQSVDLSLDESHQKALKVGIHSIPILVLYLGD